MKHIRFLFVLVPALAVLSCKNKVSETELPKAQPPNVLFISVDDLRPELNCYGAQHIISPNIDKLAAQGTQFNRAYVQQAICMASRASIMTGIRPERFGIFTGERVKDLLPNVLTLNQHFKNNGYSLAAYGKVYHFSEDNKKQFGADHTYSRPQYIGRGYIDSKTDSVIALNVAAKGKAGNEKSYPFEWKDVPFDGYEDGKNIALALKKLETFKKEGNPFFMAVGFRKPHLPFNAPKKYWDMYPMETMQMPEITTVPENSNEHTFRDFAELRTYYGMPKQPNVVSRDTTLLLRRGYFACVTYIDDMVGKLMTQLDDLGLADNTVVVLWADHGYKLGDYGNWCKFSNMRIDTRVPMIIRAPGFESKIRCDEPVETLDIFPTLTDLCGLSTPDHVEGRSLTDLMRQDYEKTDQNYAYTIWPHNRRNYNEVVMGYAVKTKGYNYVEWIDLKTNTLLETELYDHEKDPKETQNVVADATYKEVVEELRQKIAIRRANTDHDYALKKL